MALRLAAAGILVGLLFSSTEAFAQRTKFEGLRQCERYGSAQMRRQNPLFRRFVIDRAAANEDRKLRQVGTQSISTIYHGRAIYEAGSGERVVRFVCLHGGYRRGPIFVYTIPE